MNKTHTLEHLILLAYNEKGTEHSDEFIDAVTNSEELTDEYLTIMQMMDFLDSAYIEPSENSITNILNYSKALQVIPLKSIRTEHLVVRN